MATTYLSALCVGYFDRVVNNVSVNIRSENLLPEHLSENFNLMSCPLDERYPRHGQGPYRQRTIGGTYHSLLRSP